MSSPDTNPQPPSAGNAIYSLRTTRYSLLLISYFRSGWPLFIPYLAAYLLYACLKWPVNPATGDSPPSTIFRPPSLLHVYWLLHTVHLILGLIALRSWWKEFKLYLQPPASTGSFRASDSNHSPQATTHRSLPTVLWSLTPWLCLTLVFWIPGIYLEWPSDPWEHFRRINEWHALDQVTAHSSWKKSSYFLPYSLTGHMIGLTQLNWLNIYYTAVCLLLSWQYYRLARTIGFSERASFVFVLINALTFGNNIFSFYRYYGLSSSIFAQLGAVALTRIALETFRPTRPGTQTTGQVPSIRFPLPAASATLVLVPLIAFNHIQGIGIAGLGVTAVIIWRLVEWRRSMLIWLVGTAMLASVAMVFWFPRHLALDGIYRPQGWLTAWYGFNLFSPNSPAFDRAYQILGISGAINLGLAIWLIIRRNHIVGWLTLTPTLILVLPCFALPFAHALAEHSNSTANIVTFHRLLLGMPTGIALIAVGALSRQTISEISVRILPIFRLVAFRTFTFSLVAGVFILVLTPGRPAYNRFFQMLLRTAPDLTMEKSRLDALILSRTDDIPPAQLSMIVSGLAYRIEASRKRQTDRVLKLVGYSITSSVPVVDALDFVQNRPPGILLSPSPRNLYTPYSVCGLLSQHWTPQKASYEHMGGKEFEEMVLQSGAIKNSAGTLTYYRY